MASIIKADNIQKVSDGTNIIKKCGSTITLGSCGATIALACGATQTGFGRTGTVDWCTTAKTAPFTGVSGNGYFVNTTCGAVTVTLPATPSAGDIVSLKDYANTWQTNNVTLANNSSKINGICGNADLNTEDQSVTLIYVDSTKGWRVVQDSTSSVSGSAYITATGGTITNSPCGDYKIHTFTSDGTFCVSAGAGPLAVADYLVIAGGGGGANSNHGGGSGAGGFRESKNPAAPWTASPLASAISLPISIQSYPVTVGGGGAGGGSGNNGSNSVFSTITSAGGGKGSSGANGSPGGSGGGGFSETPGTTSGGTGNTPPTSPPQGNNGGNGNVSPCKGTGGGGGAGAVGSNGSGNTAGAGGAGATTSISASSTTYAGGGGGGTEAGTNGAGGPGGGGQGGPSPTGVGVGLPGTVNTGGGGGGGARGPGSSGDYNGGTGGPGIVIIRYKFQ
jgi:hypothetical protein